MAVVDTLRQDIKGAVRGLWKSPGFAVASMVTLALICSLGLFCSFGNGVSSNFGSSRRPSGTGTGGGHSCQ